jgi:catechol 2,3-dioxygenase-like lactoylglutathione lyase family enzyme
MKTLFPALRVSDLDTSLTFYRHLGYEVVGRVNPDAGTRLVMLALPTDRAHRTSPVVLIEIPHPEASLSVVVGGCRW